MGVFNYPVYHTMHDNIAWMKKFVDPDFRYHTTIGKIWTQIILLLTDTSILPLNFERYSDSLHFRVTQMARLARKNKVDKDCNFCKLLMRYYENFSKALSSGLNKLHESKAQDSKFTLNRVLTYLSFIMSTEIF